jgi:hypothetical protein
VDGRSSCGSLVTSQKRAAHHCLDLNAVAGYVPTSAPRPLLRIREFAMKLPSPRPVLVLAAVALALVGCQGSAQKAGAHVDNAAEKVRDAVTQPGPAEKAGRTLDRAVGQ